MKASGKVRLVATSSSSTIAAAIEIGTNAVRLRIGHLTPDGTVQTVFEERDPLRSGQGVFRNGRIPANVIEQLAATLARYAARCRQHGMDRQSAPGRVAAA
jgi:exopolyphosphatase/pppGpp-phosphohydrolase